MITLMFLYLSHQLGVIGIKTLHQAIFNQFFSGMSVLLIDDHASIFLSENLEKLLYQPALQKLQQAKVQGDQVIILSSSPDFLVEKVAALLNVDHWNSTIYQKNEKHCFSHIAQFMEGEQKATYLLEILAQQEIDRMRVTAYTDSYLDLPLLYAVGNPVGVNPDRRLKKICQQNAWLMI